MFLIQVLGVEGHQGTNQLTSNIQQAVQELNLNVPLKKVYDIDSLMNYKISKIPAMVIDNLVITQQEIPSVDDLKILFKLIAKKNSQSIKYTESLIKHSKSINMKKIIVPTDFSIAAKNALNYAIELAQNMSLAIEVVHVYSGLFDNNERFMIRGGMDRAQSLESDLDYFISFDEKDGSVAVMPNIRISQKVMQGMTSEVLKELSEEEDTALVVMGTTGTGGIARKLLGSVSTDLARNAKCPVLLVPEKSNFRALKHILFASNYESTDKPTIKTIMDFSTLFGAAMHFIHVEEEGNLENFKLIEQEIVETIFEGKNPKIAFEVSNVKAHSVLEGLQNYIENNAIDLMVMVAPDRTFLQNIFHQSRTKEMAFNTRIPLLVMH